MIELNKYKAGHFQKCATGYDFFLPTKINDQWSWKDAQLNQLLEKAAIKLGELNSFSRLVPDIDLFIQLHVTKEAVLSSRIEGTRTRVDEALMGEEDISPERVNDWKEVSNYMQSMNTAIARLADLPISSRLLRELHVILLENVRGEFRMPGEFRTSQNWIGGKSLADAMFIPPHPDYIAELMSDLENFIHNDNLNIPELVKVAIAHYQFETIHPFLDGNGRIGRLLITLFLFDKGILNQPLMYLSTYFERNRGLYYDNLTIVRSQNDMMHWLKYFLVGIAETAERSSRTLSEILSMKERLELMINTELGRKSQRAIILLHHLLKKPILNVNQAKEVTGLTFNAANSLIADFIEAGILREITGFERNRIFAFREYLELFEE